MESHKCSLFLNNMLFDDQAMCSFEKSSGAFYYEGYLFSQKSLFSLVMSEGNELKMHLDDGREGIIILGDAILDDPYYRARFTTSGPLE